VDGNKINLIWELDNEQKFPQSNEINPVFQVEDTLQDFTKEADITKEELENSTIAEHPPEAATTSELAELCLSIQEGVTNLFQLSMIIRKIPEKDEYIKASLRYTFDPKLDINHVGDKYPAARDGEAWLMERLGTAITRRRQYLLYRKEHQKRLEELHELSKDGDGKTVWSGTKASTFLPDDRFKDSSGHGSIADDPIMAPSRPQTEYANSSRGKDGGSDLLRTPSLPKGPDGVRTQYGEHFECPYCWRPQAVQNKNEWKSVSLHL
jgi:hypothetical protein